MTTARGLLSTRDQITDRLRDDVFAGRLAVGDKVTEATLAERFGVSRGPIREAVSMLTSEGLFVAKTNCGVTVAPPAPEAIRELVLPIRRTIEVYALKQIFAGLTADDFRHWGGVVFQMQRAARQLEWQALPSLDLAFHRYVLERAGSPDLLAIWQTIVTRMRAHFFDTAQAHHERGVLARLPRHHEELLEAFRTGTKAVAVKALERHIDEN